MASRKKTKKVVAKATRAAVAVGTVARAIKKATKKVVKKVAKKAVSRKSSAAAPAQRASALEIKRAAPAAAKPIAVKKKKASRRAEPAKAAKAVSVSTPVQRRAPSAAAATIDEGSEAPSFALLDQDSQMLSSDTLAGHPYVLYFYPKDDTPGCTKEACDFRDSLARFGSRGIRVIGVSPDAVGSHARFRDKYGLNFTLLSDPDKELAQAYGVWTLKQNYGKEYMGISRSTFLVDGNGMVHKVWRGVRVPGHIDEVLAQAEELA